MGKGFNSKTTTHSGYIFDGGTSSEYGDPPSKLVDGKKNYPYEYTKWCTSTGDKVDGIWYCEFHTESAVQVNGYTITTGHDNLYYNNRNPKDWVLKAKADAGDSWTTIATVTNDATLEDENYKPFDFIVDVHGTYQYFRFEVSATRGADVMQIEELELFEATYGTAYGDLDLYYGALDSHGLTFTAPTGKHFKKIVITSTDNAYISGWTNDGEPGNRTSTWTGDESSVSFTDSAEGVTSIVFTLE